MVWFALGGPDAQISATNWIYQICGGVQKLESYTCAHAEGQCHCSLTGDTCCVCVCVYLWTVHLNQSVNCAIIGLGCDNDIRPTRSDHCYNQIASVVGFLRLLDLRLLDFKVACFPLCSPLPILDCFFLIICDEMQHWIILRDNFVLEWNQILYLSS